MVNASGRSSNKSFANQEKNYICGKTVLSVLPQVFFSDIRTWVGTCWLIVYHYLTTHCLMDKKYYEEYYTLERTNWWFLVRNRILIDRVKKLVLPAHAKILNVGVATGSTSELLSVFGQVVSVEYDADCCKFTQERIHMPVQNASITELPFANESFDLVCAFDVIEHVEDDRKAVSELQRVCKKHGNVMVSVPMFMFLWSHHDVVNHHVRRYTLPALKALFSDTTKGEITYASFFNSLLFVPIALFRLLSGFLPQSLIRRGTGADNHVVGQQSLASQILYQLFALERPYLRNNGKFPFGVSAMLTWLKR